ncbi:MAG: DUF3147 family protein [Candidatus Delongbacteria bacterium]|nr:DUF3147 family protein [Candidatus Delongbacteria bacterium]MBN2834265.1 DUF3147 family protein [Candidatus Delongbacteria bacterium]
MDIFLKSIAGGVMVAAILIVSKLFGPKVAGIISTMPVNITIGFIILTTSGSKASEVLNGFLLGMIPLTIFILVCMFMSKYTSSMLITISTGYLIWIITFLIAKKIFNM